MRNKLLLILLFSFSLIRAQDSDIFSYNNTLKFADYLYKNGEYMLAISEFKRVLFLDSTNTLANIRIHDSYIRSGKYSEGLNFSFGFTPGNFKNDTLEILRSKMFLLTNDIYGFESELSKIKLPEKDHSFLLMSKCLFLNKWDDADKYYNKINTYPEFSLFSPIIEDAKNIKYKKPAISLAMSAVIPGSGKFYSGYWKDGLFSFLFVGISAWQSYRGFNQKGIQSAYGWIMGGISLSFYTGNLYGSVKAANRKNYELNKIVHDKFEKAFTSVYSDF